MNQAAESEQFGSRRQLSNHVSQESVTSHAKTLEGRKGKRNCVANCRQRFVWITIC
jgi:hypothetical protein